MNSRSYNTEFVYEGKTYPLDVSIHFRYQDDYCYRVILANYYIGDFVKQDGIWLPLNLDINFKNLPFELQASDYQLIGEIIERELF